MGGGETEINIKKDDCAKRKKKIRVFCIKKKNILKITVVIETTIKVMYRVSHKKTNANSALNLKPFENNYTK